MRNKDVSLGEVTSECRALTIPCSLGNGVSSQPVVEIYLVYITIDFCMLIRVEQPFCVFL